MSRTIEHTDQQYASLERAATSRGKTIAALLVDAVDVVREQMHEPRVYETEDWFRHLGASEEQIAEARRISDRRRKATNAHA